jgi:hypothetical protein
MNEELFSRSNLKSLAHILIKEWGAGAVHRGMAMSKDPVKGVMFSAVITEEIFALSQKS